MKFNFDLALEAAGSCNRYQYSLLTLSLVTWLAADFIAICMPFLKMIPEEISCLNNNIWTPCDQKTACSSEEFKIVSKYITFMQDSAMLCAYKPLIKIGISTSLGLMVGAILFSKMIDTSGRKSSLFIGNIVFLFGMCGLLYLNSNEYLVLISCFIIGVGSTGASLASYIFVIETCHPDVRGTFGNLLQSSFPIAGFLYFAINEFSQSWRYPAYFSLFSTGICSAVILLFSESARFYSKEGNTGKAAVVLYRVSCFNHTQESYLTYLMSLDNAEEERLLGTKREKILITPEDAKSKGKAESSILEMFNSKNMNDIDTLVEEDTFTFCNLFSHPKLRWIVLNCTVLWIVTVFAYYGITFSLDQVLKNKVFLAGMINYSAELVSLYTTVFLFTLTGYGRVLNYKIMYLIALIFSIPFLLTNDLYARVTCLFLVRFGIVSCYSNCYLYSNEIYPTDARSKGLGFNSLMARMALLVLAGLLEILEGDVVFIFIIPMAFVGLVVSFRLSETKGEKLKESVKEL